VFNAYPALDSSKAFPSKFSSKSDNQSEAVPQKRIKEANFYKDSTLILNDSCFFFEFGGTLVAKFSITKLKWK